MIYKVTTNDGMPCNGGIGKWSLPKGSRPGDWMPATKPELCRSGYHLCDGELHLLAWLGGAIWEAEYRGQRLDDNNKICVAEARLVRRLPWDDRQARLFAADCAERVLHIFERDSDDQRPRQAIAAARLYAIGECDKLYLDAARAAARAAARDAARGAAWDAARTAALDAAWDAARDAALDAARDAALGAARGAAWDAARTAALDAAWDAAWDAARDAEKKWQAARLRWYLDGCPLPVPADALLAAS